MPPNSNSNVGINIKSGPKRALQVSATSDYLDGVIKQINVLFGRQQFCDVILIADNDKFKVEAHRLVLSAASPYFLAMFGGSLREADAKEVILKQIDGRCLEAIINFIYTASIELTTDTVEDMIKSAHLFQLDSLEVLCSDFIADQLDPSNCFEIALFAEFYDFKLLYRAAVVFVCQHFMELRNGKELFLLSPEQLSKFISSDELCLSSEEEVFNTVVSWVDHDKPKRQKFIEKLLQHVRFPLLSPKFIAETVESACKSIECERLVFKAYKWHLMPEFRASLFSNNQTKVRNFKNTISAISGWNNPDGILHVGFLYSGLNEWIYREWPGPLERRYNFGSTVVNNQLVIAGGTLASGNDTNSVECLDLRTLKWRKLPAMRAIRRSFGMTTLNGEVYAVGGCNNSIGLLNSVEKWNPKNAMWQNVTSMNHSHENPRVYVRQNALCVAIRNVTNGWVSKFVHNVYDPQKNDWFYNWLTTTGDLLGAGSWRTSLIDYYIFVTTSAVTRI